MCICCYFTLLILLLLYFVLVLGTLHTNATNCCRFLFVFSTSPPLGNFLTAFFPFAYIHVMYRVFLLLTSNKLEISSHVIFIFHLSPSLTGLQLERRQVGRQKIEPRHIYYSFYFFYQTKKIIA